MALQARCSGRSEIADVFGPELPAYHHRREPSAELHTVETAPTLRMCPPFHTAAMNDDAVNEGWPLKQCGSVTEAGMLPRSAVRLSVDKYCNKDSIRLCGLFLKAFSTHNFSFCLTRNCCAT
ncbi:uncharacterized protein LOC142775835 [Rhipicephalus microplus]|uniref:uncharacterized protein LOC142775835 n=1 Tax=Rhipicephalus microplus TaxID=6941 RepID=UPI003F6D58CE